MPSNPLGLYPNSDLKGNPIPFDIMLVIASTMKAFTQTPSSDHALPENTDILVVHGDPEFSCWIELDGDAGLPTDGVFQNNLIFIKADSITVIDANGAAAFGIVSDTSDAGEIKITAVKAYRDTRKSKQHSSI